MSIIAIITARGGSKGLPRKNIRELAGKPLIAYSIQAALECPHIDRCIVSTEDSEIKRISINCGAEVIDRPTELAQDSSTSQAVVKHVLETVRYQNSTLPDYFVLLQPTSPLRNAGHLTECIEMFMGSQYRSAISVTEAGHHPFKMLTFKDDKLIPLFGREYLDMPRQLLPEVFRQNGAIYLMSSEVFLKEYAFFADTAMPYLMSEYDSIDIDSEMDLLIAEAVMRNRYPR